MITCVNFKNWNEFGGILHSQFCLRYKQFIERQQYSVKSYVGMEFDQYDTPAATYLVYHDENQKVLGVSRLVPTMQGCMLNEIFPSLVLDQPNLVNEDIWEGTRYCIDKDVSPELRRQIINEMALAYLEFGLLNGLRKIVGMMPTAIYKSVFEKPGIEMEYLGDVQIIDGLKCRAVAIPVNRQQLENVRSKTGIRYSTLRFSLNNNTEYIHERAA